MTSSFRAINPKARMVRYLRRGWRRLTSMRTALVLLFFLAIVAVPGSVLPQRPLNPTKTAAYISMHGAWGRFLDRIGMFDVFGSAWFAAIYLLLGLSLVGCLVPRIRAHARALRNLPPPAPRRLARLPESGAFGVVGTSEDLATTLRAALGRRWRVAHRAEPGGVVTLSAEKGYLRETGNLIFHIALLVAVVAIAVDRLYSYEGAVIVRKGHGFCNTALDLDSLRTGRLAGSNDLASFCVDRLDDFTATYTSSGGPTSFVAKISYSQGSDGTPTRHTITVNHPLRLDGDRVYLTGHGFAPTFSVRMPDGTMRTSTGTFLPVDPMLTSEGVVKLQGSGKGQDIAIQGAFAPDAVLTTAGILGSRSPAPRHPAVAIFIYRGDLGLRTGVPQSVYRLDTRQIATGALRHLGSATLVPGQRTTLPGGVEVTFDGYIPWANFQVSHNPAQDYLLLAALGMLVGLVCSLTLRRRRIWLRLTPVGDTDDGRDTSPRTDVEIGGLARSDSGNFSNEFSAILTRLRAVVPAAETARRCEGADR